MEPTIRHHIRYRAYHSPRGRNVENRTHWKKPAAVSAAIAAGMAVLIGLCLDCNATLALLALIGAIAVAVTATCGRLCIHCESAHTAMDKKKRTAIIAAAIYGILLAFCIVLVASGRFFVWDAFMQREGFFMVGLPTVLVAVLLVRALFK